MSDKETQISEEEITQIEGKWSSARDIPTIFATHLIISHNTGKEFYLFFGEAQPPLLLGLPGETIPTEVEIKPIAKIVVTPETMLSFGTAINNNITKFIDRFGNKFGFVIDGGNEDEDV